MSESPWENVPEGREHPEGAPGIVPNVLRQFFGDSDYEVQRAQSAEHHDLHIAAARAQLEREEKDHALGISRYERVARLEELKWAFIMFFGGFLALAVCCLIMAVAWAVIH